MPRRWLQGSPCAEPWVLGPHLAGAMSHGHKKGPGQGLADLQPGGGCAGVESRPSPPPSFPGLALGARPWPGAGPGARLPAAAPSGSAQSQALS